MHDPLQEGIRLFNDHQFFASHEVLEELWTTDRGPRRLLLQSLIHLAVGLHHLQRGNRVGAASQLTKGLRKLAPYLPSCAGIDTARLYRDAETALHQIEAGLPAIDCPRIYPRLD